MKPIKFIDIEIYRVRLYFCETAHQIEQLTRNDFPDYRNDEADDHALGLFKSWCRGYGYRTKAAIYASSPETLAHEASHLAVDIFDRIGCPIDYGHDEPFAYLIGFIVLSYTRALYPQCVEWK